MKIFFTITGYVEVSRNSYPQSMSDEAIAELEKDNITDGELQIFDLEDLKVNVAIHNP